MEDPKFISHSQFAPPSSVPRQGLGLFSVLAIVVAVLAFAFSGGLWLLAQSNEQQKAATVERLKELESTIELASLRNIKDVQDRIELAQRLLENHIYASQAFVFAERHTLSPIHIRSFDFTQEMVKMDLSAPGYTEFAQQIKYYKSSATQGIIKSYTFKPPVLAERGRIDFSVEVTLTPEYLRTKPSSNAPAVAESVSLPADDVEEDL